MNAIANGHRFTPGQRARLARAVEAARAAQAEQQHRGRMELRHHRDQECALAERLLEHVCPESVVDRGSHALGVARMILNSQRSQRRRPK